MNQISNSHLRPSTKVSEKSFKEDILKLFLGLKTAHLSSYTFEYGSHLWQDFFNTPSDYYVVKDEIDLIKDNVRTIRKICSGVQNVFDLGPGSEGAITNKTLPILKSLIFSLQKYQAIDISTEYLDGAEKIISKELPDIDINLIHQNFFDHLNLDINHRSLGLLFGLTLSNMPGIYDKVSGINYLREEMRLFRKLMPKNSYLLCSYDTCQDERKLMRAYNHPKHAKFIENIVSAIKFDLPIVGDFDENAWSYNPQWDADNHMFKHIVTSKKPMSFSLDNNSFHVPKDYNILSYVSVKFPEEIYLQIFDEVGLELATLPFKGPNGDINISLLRAI